MYYLGHPEDCSVVRNDDSRPGFVIMKDCDGKNLFSAPENWTNEQMFYVLNIVNHAYSRGVSFGELKKTQQVRNVLGI